MSIENVIYGPETKSKMKALTAKHNKAIMHVKAIGLGDEQEKTIIDSVKTAYVKEHAQLLEDGLDLDADISFTPKTRQKKVKEAPEVKQEPAKPLTPAEKAKATKLANAAKNKVTDEDPAA